MSEAITRTLPFLRRYARAVTGSQKRGDEWVRLCAEVVMRQPDLITKVEDTKLGVFALFHRLRQPFGNLEEGAGADSVSGRLKESLTDMAPLQRQVLLLTVLEGFTVADAGRILGIDADDIVRNAGHQVVGIAATEKTAVELAKQHSPHLVLADIQLRGSDSGIAAVNQIMRSMSVPVIFVTGYPERLLTGKQVEPAFVISKPFDPDLLRAAIAQALDTVSI